MNTAGQVHTITMQTLPAQCALAPLLFQMTSVWPQRQVVLTCSSHKLPSSGVYTSFSLFHVHARPTHPSFFFFLVKVADEREGKTKRIKELLKSIQGIGAVPNRLYRNAVHWPTDVKMQQRYSKCALCRQSRSKHGDTEKQTMKKDGNK
jgi:hypothetical protein